MKHIALMLLVSATALAAPTPPGPPSGPPPVPCTANPGTTIARIETAVTGLLAQHGRVTIASNGAWRYELAEGAGPMLERASGCLDATKLAALKADHWMSDFSALAATLQDPGPIVRSPGKPVR
jgi:VCBS repeat-containing protein